MKKMATINPAELSNAEKERCFVPRWTVGAVDALHEAFGGLPRHPFGGCKPPCDPCPACHLAA